MRTLIVILSLLIVGVTAYGLLGPSKHKALSRFDIEVHATFKIQDRPPVDFVSARYSIVAEGTMTNIGSTTAPLVDLVLTMTGFSAVAKEDRARYDAQARAHTDALLAEMSSFSSSPPPPPSASPLSLPPPSPSPLSFKSASAYYSTVADTFRNLKPGETRPFKVVIPAPREHQVLALGANEALGPWSLDASMARFINFTFTGQPRSRVAPVPPTLAQ